MEDSLEKLEIMKACDFSMHSGEIKRYSGFGNAVHGFSGAADVFAKFPDKTSDFSYCPGKERELVNIMFNAYGFICIHYASIPFERLDPEDEDFKPLFEIRDLLPELGKAAYDLITHPIKKKEFRDIRGSEPYQRFVNIIKRIAEADDPPYRDRIVSLEKRVKLPITAELWGF